MQKIEHKNLTYHSSIAWRVYHSLTSSGLGCFFVSITKDQDKMKNVKSEYGSVGRRCNFDKWLTNHNAILKKIL